MGGDPGGSAHCGRSIRHRGGGVETSRSRRGGWRVPAADGLPAHRDAARRPSRSLRSPRRLDPARAHRGALVRRLRWVGCARGRPIFGSLARYALVSRTRGSRSAISSWAPKVNGELGPRAAGAEPPRVIVVGPAAQTIVAFRAAAARIAPLRSPRSGPGPAGRCRATPGAWGPRRVPPKSIRTSDRGSATACGRP